MVIENNSVVIGNCKNMSKKVQFSRKLELRGALKDKNYKISGFWDNAFPEIFSGIDRARFTPTPLLFASICQKY
jgi:hypothetical protein